MIDSIRRSGPRLAVAAALAFALPVACGGKTSDGPGETGGAGTSGAGGTGACVTGNERCACYGNGTCNGSLTCLSNLCVSVGGGGAGAAGTTGGAGVAGTTGGPGSGGSGLGTGGQGGMSVTCSNADRNTLPIDSTGWVARECNNRNIQGAWYCFDDNVVATSCVDGQPPYSAASAGMCLSGNTVADSTFAAWGGGLGLGLNQAGGGSTARSAYNATANGVMGFRITIAGNLGGNPLRVVFTGQEDVTGIASPFYEVTGIGTFDVPIASAQVPATWSVPNAGATANPASIFTIEFQIPGGNRAAAYNFCVTRVTPILSGTTGTAGTTGSAGTSGTAGRGGTTGTAGTTGTGGLPPLTVVGTRLQDPTGKTIILRGSSLIDIGALYAWSGNSAAAITARMDRVAAAGVQGHAVRLPVYPKISYNGDAPFCSPLPYPVGTGPSTTCTPTTPMTAADYVARVLRPAVDYARGKNLYVIIDYHQIDNAVTGTSAADATTFWTDVAAQFASYANVLYEPFNEPIDPSATWATFKPVVQGWINTIRARAPNNIIIVPSMRWDQHPGDAASNPPTGTNLMFTAHIYPDNWSQAFQTQLATALARAPVFITEWGYTYSLTQTGIVYTSSPTWGTDFQTLINGNGASWIAWVTDNAWAPPMFTDTGITQLSEFGTLVKSWLASKANSDWVQ